MSALETFRSRLFRRSRSERVVEVYETALKHFLGYKGLDADVFAEKIRDGTIDLVQEMNLWLDKLNERKIAPSTMKNYYYAVKKFVEVVDPDSEYKWKRVDLPKIWTVEEDRVPTKKELKEILNHADLKSKVMVLVAASSGVRQGTLARLSVGDVDFDSYQDIAVIKIKPENAKGKVAHATCMTPEARNVLLQYLDLRKRRGETLIDDSPLLRSRTGNHYIANGIRVRWLRLIKRADKAVKQRKYFSLHFHTLRKFFRTNLELAGVSKTFTERFLGHKPYLDQSYFKPQIDMLVAEYRKAIPHLTIVEQAAEYEEMRKRQLVDTARLLGFGEEKLSRLQEVLARAKTTDEAIEKFKRLGENPEPKENNGVKVVTGEKALVDQLKQGWTLIKELNHNKYLLKMA